MRRFGLFLLVFAVVVAMGTMPRMHRTAHAAAQSSGWSIGDCKHDEGNTHNHWGWDHQERVCQLRTTVTKLGGDHLGVTTVNGGIEVSGEDRSDVEIEARVQAWAGSASEASDILQKVQIETTGDNVRDRGPEFHIGNRGYSVSYRLRVPRQLSVNLKTMNGGIDIAHLDGEIQFDTTNGGVGLQDLAGNVHGQTVNGGLDIALSGDRWQGEGLNVETTNGGVSLRIPEGYSAHLETGTVNGGLALDFPVTIQGSIKNRLSTDLGGGGSTIHAETTNGGVEVTRGSAGSASI